MQPVFKRLTVVGVTVLWIIGAGTSLAISEDKNDAKHLLIHAQSSLASFGYGTTFTGILDERTKTAIKEYQAYNQLDITGALDEKTLEQIHADLENIEPPKPGCLLQFYTDSWGEGVFVAQGALIEKSTGDKADLVRIECHKDRGICIVCQSMEPTVPSVYIYDITGWDNDKLTASIEGLCGSTEIQVNRVAKSLLSITSTNPERCKKDLLGRPVSPTTRILELVDSWKLYEQRLGLWSKAVKRVKRLP